MGRIKNMGTATMKFKEGIIVTGPVPDADGSDSGFSLVVSGNMKIAEGADLIFQKDMFQKQTKQLRNLIS